MKRLGVLFAAALCASCIGAEVSIAKPEAAAPADWKEWQANRQLSVAGTNGWTTVIGRHWLKEGSNFAGSDPTNHVVLPAGRAAAQAGNFRRQGQTVTFEAASGVLASVNGERTEKVLMRSDAESEPTRLQIGELSMVLIARGDRLGLRVRDPQAPARLRFAGLAYFPYNPAWRISGRFEPFARAATLRVPDMIGGVQEFRSPGALVFSYGGKEYRLQVAEEPGEEDFFVMFRDVTAADRTYPTGRFLYVARPKDGSGVIIDFNRAYTPPCGFTEFSTCPLPPRRNWLPFAVEAGELQPAGH